MTTNERCEMIRQALLRIDRARVAWQKTQIDASSTADQRALAKRVLEATEAEFAWQADNVRALLFPKGVSA